MKMMMIFECKSKNDEFYMTVAADASMTTLAVLMGMLVG